MAGGDRRRANVERDRGQGAGEATRVGQGAQELEILANLEAKEFGVPSPGVEHLQPQLRSERRL